MNQELKNTLIRQLKTIGWLAIALPFLSAGFAWLVQYFPNSISATYHMSSKIFLIGILTSASFYMISYVGYNKTDRILSTISGIFGLMIIAFPCGTSLVEGNIGFLNLPQHVSNLIHSISAVIFFLTQTWIIGVQFRKGDLNPTEGKIKRNKVFTLCAISIIISTIILFCLNIIFEFKHFIWLCEVIPLISLGYAYTVKASSWKWLNDKYIK
jgi:hypothetical protein